MKHKSIFRMALIAVLDILTIVLAGGVGLFVRYDFSFGKIAVDAITAWQHFLPFQVVGTLVVYFLRRMYHYLWRSVSTHDVVNMVFSVLLAFTVSALVAWACGCTMMSSMMFIVLLCQLIFHVGMRCALRIVTFLRRSFRGRNDKQERIMLIGAGEAGRMLLQEIQSSGKVRGKVCCLIDDNPNKWGKYLEGVRIYGGRDRIQGLVEREHITQIILAIPPLPI